MYLAHAVTQAEIWKPKHIKCTNIVCLYFSWKQFFTNLTFHGSMTVKLNIMHLLLFSKCIIWQHYLRHSPWECYISVITHCFHQWPLKLLEERLASTFSLQYHPWIKCKGHDNSENDRQFERLLIIKQILLVSTIGNGIQGNAKRTGYRIWLTLWECKD